MKFKPEHYAELKRRLGTIADQLPAHRAALWRQHREQDPRYLPVKDPGRRLLWDAFWATKIHRDHSPQDFDYTDAHIETALRAAFRELNITTGE